jgi:hypothetical protein
MSTNKKGCPFLNSHGTIDYIQNNKALSKADTVASFP